VSQSTPLNCCRCGETENLVQDKASGRIYCDWCADELSRICWGEPARIVNTSGEPV